MSDELLQAALSQRDAAETEVEQLRRSLDDLTDVLQDALGYVSDYSRQRWRYDEAVAWARDVAGGRTPPGEKPHRYAHSGDQGHEGQA